VASVPEATGASVTAAVGSIVALLKVFDEPVSNYTRESPFIWEEIASTTCEIAGIPPLRVEHVSGAS
jgi:hypothetical protein